MSTDNLITRIAYVLEELDRIPANMKSNSPYLRELETLLELYSSVKKDQKLRNPFFTTVDYFNNDKKRAAVK